MGYLDNFDYTVDQKVKCDADGDLFSMNLSTQLDLNNLGTKEEICATLENNTAAFRRLVVEVIGDNLNKMAANMQSTSHYENSSYSVPKFSTEFEFHSEGKSSFSESNNGTLVLNMNTQVMAKTNKVSVSSSDVLTQIRYSLGDHIAHTGISGLEASIYGKSHNEDSVLMRYSPEKLNQYTVQSK